MAHNHEIPGSNPGPATTIDPAAHPGGGPKDGSADVPSRSRPNYLAVYLPVETAILAAVGAAERGETPGSYISRAVVEHIKRNGGIAKLSKTLARTQASDRRRAALPAPLERQPPKAAMRRVKPNRQEGLPVFDIVRLLAGLWVVLMGAASLWFIFSDFDRTRREEWFALALMLPAILWAGWLACADLLSAFGQTTAVFSFILPGSI